MADSSGSRVRRFTVGAVAASVALLGAASVALAADQAVAISGFSFSPATVTVSVGDTVTWTNSDAQAHTATADNGSFDTGAISNGASDSVTFSAAGTFPYHCSIHSEMTGSVVVQAAAGGGGGGGGGAAPTTPPTDTQPDSASARAIETSALGLLVLAAAWFAGLALVRRRFATKG